LDRDRTAYAVALPAERRSERLRRWVRDGLRKPNRVSDGDR
jgi:hypothetical protein